MKFIYWTALIVGGSLLAWFLWRKVEPQKTDTTGKTDYSKSPTATVADANGNLRAYNYKQAPNAGLLAGNKKGISGKQGIGIDNVTIIETLPIGITDVIVID